MVNRYITFSKLGNHGRLGNQIFQYSVLYSLSRHFNAEIVVPTKNIELFNCFDLPTYQIKLLESCITYTEKQFKFNSDIFNSFFCNYYGYFQSEKYFKNVEEELKHILKFKTEHTNITLPKEKSAFVHIRRGDYLKHPDIHLNLTKKYYENVLKKYENECNAFYILSDDIEWCKNNFTNVNVHFVSNKNQYEDLYFMSMCDVAIIANSSFSWWGAWLNKNKKVIAPDRWFGTKGPKDFQDIYCKNWLKETII